MTEEEFNLSERIWEFDWNEYEYGNEKEYMIKEEVILLKDVKEFIRRLKEEFACYDVEMQAVICKGKNVLTILDEIIDKLAGERLIK